MNEEQKIFLALGIMAVVLSVLGLILFFMGGEKSLIGAAWILAIILFIVDGILGLAGLG